MSASDEANRGEIRPQRAAFAADGVAGGAGGFGSEEDGPAASDVASFEEGFKRAKPFDAIGGFERERPGLPALALNGDAITTGTVARNHGRAESYARQVRALGHPGDLLVILSTDGRDSNLVQAIRAAHDRDMGVLALTGGEGEGDCTALLDVHDIELHVPSEVPSEVHQVHMLTLFCLCDLIDSSLFGGYED